MQKSLQERADAAQIVLTRALRAIAKDAPG
jgi:hypothetical protein